MFSLEGKVAVVTGGGSGIGLAIVRRFADAGATVVIADLQNCSALADELGAVSIATDVADDSSVAALVHEVVDRFRRIDVLVNNAGIASDAADLGVEGADDEVARKLYEVNSLGVLRGIKHAAPVMGQRGSIINMASLAGVLGFPGFPAYSMSKAAAVAVTKSAALELADRGIRVNAVCPGFVETPMTEADSVDYPAFTERVAPLGRLGRPEDIAATVHFLASDDAAYITGQAINVGGGLSVGVSSGVLEWGLEGS